MALKKKKIVKKSAKKSIKKSAKKKIIKKKIIKKFHPKKKAAPKKKPTIKKPAKTEGNLIGAITHYFPHVQAAVIKLKAPLAKGDTVKIKGHTTDLTQLVTSMQIDRVDIDRAKKGDEIGLLVSSRVRQADKVYKI
jgi:translation elongation factor EF-Tu-like GTPase